MDVPFLDLRAQYRTIAAEIEPAVLDVLRSGTYVLGPEVAAFESEFAERHGVRYGVAVNNGTSALHVALLAAGIGEGDEVITVSMTFVATAAAIRYAGAKPVFVDVDDETCTMDPSKVEAAITPKTRAIMPVHLYGQPAEMDAILEIAKRHGLDVIEDAAQAHCAEYAGRRVGGLGRVAGFSFYPGKNLGAYGEAGIAVTNDERIAHRMRLLRDWGQERKYYHDVPAFNYRMDAIQGAILRVKLRALEQWTEERRAHAQSYDVLLRDSGIRFPVEAQGRRHVYHIYGIRTSSRERLQTELSRRGIGTGIHYPVPVHLQKAYADLGYKTGDLPVTEAIANEQLSLPMFAELTEQQIEYVCQTLRDIQPAA